MSGLKKILSILLCAILVSSGLASTTAFTISPLTSQATVTSVGQTAIHYTITNNSLGTISGVSVNESTGSSGVDLTLTNNNCTGATLTSSGTCSFDIAASGNVQNRDFTLQPQVCGFNRLLCSNPATSVGVSLIRHPLPVRLYEIVFPLNISSEYLVGINIANTSDIIRTPISEPNSDGVIAISKNGSKIYVAHQKPDSTYVLLTFNASASHLTESGSTVALSFQGKNLNLPGNMALTKDGRTIYITDRGYNGLGYPVYKVNLSNGAVTGISDSTTDNLVRELRGIALSPDDTTVYVSNSTQQGSDSTCKIFQFPNSASTTSINTVSAVTDLDAINSLFLSSDGSELYVGGQSSTSNFAATIKQYSIDQGFTLSNTFLPTPRLYGNILGAALSPDNSSIYAVALNGSAFYLYDINTANMTAGTGSNIPYNILGFRANFPYIAIAPNNSYIGLLNYGSGGNLTGLFPPSSPDVVTIVNPAPLGSTMISNTIANFIG